MRKGLIQILGANIILLLVNILNSFLLPKYVSIETYAIIKTYTLYIGYAGFLSLGFADGMYLKFGGMDYSNINKQELSDNVTSYIFFEFIVSGIFLVISLLTHNYLVTAFSIGSFCINIIGYYKNLYQAVGEYSSYSKTVNYQPLLCFLFNILLIFAVKTNDPSMYVSAQVMSSVLVAIYLSLAIHLRKKVFRSGKISLLEIKDNIFNGFSLMLGNFSSSLFTSIDRWFVKLLLTNNDFAYYSFAVSIENIVSVFVSPITVSLYNIFCKGISEKRIMFIKRCTLVWGFIVISAAFPIRLVIEMYLPKYNDSVLIIEPLLLTQVFYSVIKGIHVNLLKAEKRQNSYFRQTLIMSGIAFGLNSVFFIILPTAFSFAIATFFTALIWFVYSELKRKNFVFSLTEYLLTCLLICFHLFLFYYVKPAIAFLLYVCSVGILLKTFMGDIYSWLLDQTSMMLKSFFPNH